MCVTSNSASLPSIGQTGTFPRCFCHQRSSALTLQQNNKEVIFRQKVGEDPIFFLMHSEMMCRIHMFKLWCKSSISISERDLARALRIRWEKSFYWIASSWSNPSDGLGKCPRNNGHRPSSYADASKENTSQHVSKTSGWYEAICTKIRINRSMKIKIY